MNRPRHRLSDAVEDLYAAAIDEAFMARARRMATHPNPEVPLWIASLSDAYMDVVGQPALEHLLLYGEALVRPDPTVEELAGPMARAMERNRAYLERAREEMRADEDR